MNYFAERPVNETDRNCPEDDSHRPQGDNSGTMQRGVSRINFYIEISCYVKYVVS